MAPDPIAGRVLDLHLALLQQAVGDLGHGAALLAADVVVVIGARLVMRPAVSKVDPFQGPVLLERHGGPEHARRISRLATRPHCVEKLLERPCVPRALEHDAPDRISYRGRARHMAQFSKWLRPGCDGASLDAMTAIAAAIQLSEILAPLTLVTDLARDHPPEEAMRACLLAPALGKRLSLSPTDLSDVYYTTLLRLVGCTASSEIYAEATDGDDVAVR